MCLIIYEMVVNYNANQKSLSDSDLDVFRVIEQEEYRQRVKLEMIASENFTSRAVLEATGSVLTNKYAEGYPGNRYYGGCEVIDKVEILAIERAKKLFGAEYANVQPHSGSSANLAVYTGFLSPGDGILGMSLAHGGHLSHGARVSFSGKNYHSVSYGVREDTEQIDLNEVEEKVKRHRPKIVVAGASSYTRKIDFRGFSEIAHRYDSMLLADIAHIAGLVIAGIHPTPVPHADVVTSTTHKTLRGPRGGLIVVGKDRENFFNIVNPRGKKRKYSHILNSAIMPGLQGGPLMHVVAAKAVAFRECMEEPYIQYVGQVVKNAGVLSQALIDGGARVVSGGTDVHMVLVDVRSFGVNGKEAEHYLDEANISANKNGIPFDTENPQIGSGIRLGTPALTSRGMKEEEMKIVAKFILEVLKSKGRHLSRVAKKVEDFSLQYPMREAEIEGVHRGKKN